jgi:PAS domain S-box-containing protein
MASSGIEALEMISKFEPDLVVMDIVLEGDMDGITCAGIISTRFNTPVIFLTAYADDSILERVKISDPYAYIIKPIKQKELITAIDIAIYKHRLIGDLRKSEQKFRNMIDSSPVAMAIVSDDGLIEYLNAYFIDSFGFTRSDIPSCGIWWDTAYPDEHYRHAIRDAWTQRLAVAHNEGIGFSPLEASVVCYDGSKKDVEYRVAMIGDRILVILNDITMIKSTERALHESEDRIRAIFDNASAGITVMDSSGKIIQHNQRYAKLLGYENMSMNGIYIDDITHPDDIRNTRENISRILSGEKDSAVIEKRYIRKNGNSFWASVAASPILDDNASVRQIISVIFDISDQKKAEIESQRLFAAIEHASDIIIITDSEGLIQYVNPAFEKKMGYTRYEALGNTLDFIKSGRHDGSFYDELNITVRAGSVWSGRFVNRTKNGDIVIHESSISPIKNTDDTIIGYVSVNRDVTEQEKLEWQLIQSQKIEAIGTLAGGLAHDFNNLLSGIVGSINLLEMIIEKEILRDRVSIQWYIDTINESSERAIDLIKQLLSLTRKQELQLSTIDINSSLQRVLKICKNTFPKNILLQFNLGSDPILIKADPAQIDQMLLNLCMNASHAMTIMKDSAEKAGGTLTVTAGERFSDSSFCQGHHEARKDIWYGYISVNDTGVGMDQHIVSRIFDPFFTTKEKGMGSGLGLAMVYNSVKQHNGVIDVHSAQGKGSTFTIYIPRTFADGVDQTNDKKAIGIQKGEGTILVVDDEDLVRRVIDGILTACGYRVLQASSGAESIRIYKENSSGIDAVIIDLSMPVMSGTEVYAELKMINPNIKALIASGYSEKENIRRILDMGINGFVQKPFSAENLSRIISGLLSDH